MSQIAVLNLANPELSVISYKIIKFPDGQQSLTIETDITDIIAVKIYSRLNNFKDLEIILCATAALKNLGMTDIFLYVPYFLGARSDRKFEKGSINYIKDIIAPIINAQEYKSVIILDPHSDVLEACIKNFEKINNNSLVKNSIDDIVNQHNIAKEDIILVSPDAGALKKIYDVAKFTQIESIVTASKVRELSTGKIIRTDVPLPTVRKAQIFVIIDDICDGGRTFIEIAKAIRENRKVGQFRDKIYLIVTHGIFSAGLCELSKWIDGIYTTNSVKNINASEYSDFTVNDSFITQFKVI
jgi:ribose-phosphate pyrophosphokinase